MITSFKFYKLPAPTALEIYVDADQKRKSDIQNSENPIEKIVTMEEKNVNDVHF